MNSELNKFRIEAESSIRFLYCSIAFDKALGDEVLLKNINKNPDYWRLFEASMISSVFLAIRRLYESKGSSFNIQGFIKSCIRIISDFSLESLKERKVQSGALSPERAELYVADKYEPSEDDFKEMGRFIRSRSKAMKEAYTNVASTVYAHAIHFSHSEALAPNQDLNLYEIEKAFLSVWHVYEQAWQLYQNGKRPEYHETKYQYKSEVIDSIMVQVNS